MTGKFMITTELLVQILHLPEGTRLIDLSMSDDGRYGEVTVEHDSIESPQVQPTYQRDASGVVSFVSWGGR